jgi:hypothetical protein
MGTIESDVVDRIRRNDNSLRRVVIHDWESDAVGILDALKNNLVVKKVSLYIFRDITEDNLLEVNQEAFVKLSEVTKCNKSVESLTMCLRLRLSDERRNQVFAVMGTSGGWSSIQELVLVMSGRGYVEPLSLREARHISSFIIKSENLRALTLDNVGHGEPGPIVEILSHTKVQSLKICFYSPFFLQNEGRQLTTALERCTCITELRLKFSPYHDQVEFFQILLLESIPKMLGLKKLKLEIYHSFDQQFFDMVGQCIGGHQGEIEELRLILRPSSVNSLSRVVGLAPALRRLKVIHFGRSSRLTLQEIGELSGIAADCDTLEEFGYSLADCLHDKLTDEFKAICQLWSRFPSLKRVSKDDTQIGRARCIDVIVDLREESRFVAFLGMVKASKTIEQVPPFQCGNAEEEATIKHHCRNNMVHNQIRENGLLAAKVPSSAWPLILKEFSDIPDVLYYLLQEKHGAMIGPTRQGRVLE